MIERATIPVVVCSNDQIFLEGLRRFIEPEKDISNIHCFAGFEEMLTFLPSANVDVLILDSLTLSEYMNDEIELGTYITRIIELSPQTKILIISSQMGIDELPDLLKTGMAGYLPKESTPDQIMRAIRLLHSGDAVVNLEELQEAIINLAESDTSSESEIASQLRPRELEVLSAIASGLSNKEISANLGISVRTVQSHVANLFNKLRVSSRTEAVSEAVKLGIITLEDFTSD